MVITIDGIGLTDRQAIRMVSSVVQALGFDLMEMVVSYSTIRRERAKYRALIAERLKGVFEVDLKT